MTDIAKSRPASGLLARYGSWAALAVALVVVLAWTWLSAGVTFNQWRLNTTAFSGDELMIRNYAVIAMGSAVRAAVVWAVLYFGVVRWLKGGFGGLWDFAILLVVPFVLQAGALHLQMAKVERSRAEVLSQGRISKIGMRAAADASMSLAAVDTRPTGGGDAGAIQRANLLLVGALSMDTNRFDVERKKLGFPEVVSPARLGAPGGLKTARARIVEARAGVEKHRAYQLERLAALRSAIAQSDAGARVKAGELKLYDQTYPATRDAISRTWDLEASYLNELDGAVAALARRQGQWRSQAGGIGFRNQADLDDFRARSARLEAIQREQQTREMHARGDLSASLFEMEQLVE